MESLWLDYQTRRRHRSRYDLWLLGVGLLLVLAIGVRYVHVARATAELEDQSARRHAAHGERAHNAAQMRTEVAQANEVLAQLALPWGGLFDDMEASQGGTVALLAIEPDPKARTVRITGEAKSYAAMLSYVASLQHKRSLTDVYLQNHHVEERIAEHPVRFTVGAAWVMP